MSKGKGSSCVEDSVPPILLQKWRQLFDFLDINNDGVWTMKDMEMIQAKMMTNPNMTPEKRKEASQMIHDMWVQNMGGDLNGTMSFEQWLPRVKALYDKGVFEKALTKLRTRMFYCIDLDGDGMIDFKEFQIVGSAAGRSEMPYLDKAFQAIDTNRDGLISLGEYVDAYVKYACDPTVRIEALPLFGLPREFADCTGAFAKK